MARIGNLQIDLDTGSDAFADGNCGAEVARILRGLADVAERGGLDEREIHGLYDLNGNQVGWASVTAGEDAE